MMLFIISLIAAILQVILIVKWSGHFYENKKKRKLFKTISAFHTTNYEELISNIMKVDALNAHITALAYLNMYEDVSKSYFSGCTLVELESVFLQLKNNFAKYLPDVKKELRNDNIDDLLNSK